MVESEVKRYDYLVIGAGSGGIASARRAAQHGAKVCIIENRVVGGTCVNVGCVPKKVMFNLANWLEEANIIKDYGVQGTEGLKLDFKTFKGQRDAYVKRLNAIYDKNLGNSGVDYVEGLATFKENKVVAVGDKLFTGEHILIASGSTPELGKFEGSQNCMNSDHFFEMEELPESMILIGGGYIGVELAMIMAAFGVKTTLVVRSQVLKQLDRDVVDRLEYNIKHLGITLLKNAPHKAVRENSMEGTYTLVLDSKDETVPKEIKAQKILLAMGRPPNVEPLLLKQNTQIEIENGAVKVDEYQNTTVPGVYSIGDVCSIGVKWSLTPVAVRAGRMLSERLFNGKTDLKLHYKNIATVIFAHPPIGSVGMTETEAIKELGEENVKVYKTEFINMFYSPAKNQEDKLKTYFKVICHKQGETPDTHKVIGCACIGKYVDEMMQTLSIAVTMGATKQDFDNSVAIHPTAAEEWACLDPNYIM